jgi:hypothetical protein
VGEGEGERNTLLYALAAAVVEATLREQYFRSRPAASIRSLSEQEGLAGHLRLPRILVTVHNQDQMVTLQSFKGADVTYLTAHGGAGGTGGYSWGNLEAGPGGAGGSYSQAVGSTLGVRGMIGGNGGNAGGGAGGSKPGDHVPNGGGSGGQVGNRNAYGGEGPGMAALVLEVAVDQKGMVGTPAIAVLRKWRITLAGREVEAAEHTETVLTAPLYPPSKGRCPPGAKVRMVGQC